MRRGSAVAAVFAALLLSVGVRSAGPGAEPLTGYLQVSAVDAETGLALAAAVEVSLPWEARLLHTGVVAAPATILELPSRELRVRVLAEEHRGLEATFHPAAGQLLPVVFRLDPVAGLCPPPPQIADGEGLLTGVATDGATGGPLADATVQIEGGGPAVVTGHDGSYRLAYRAGPVEESGLPPRGSLRISREGYGELRLTGIVLTGGVERLSANLYPGGSSREEPFSHKLYSSLEELALVQSAPHDEEPLAVEARAPGSGLDIAVVTPPASIRVGMSCSCTTCGTVDVLSLETYVRRGLNDEWISSWDGDSLRAGAIAYRSYGAYYTAHPLNANYDICSTTCCQVNDTDTSASTDAAVNATAGILLLRSGSVLRSEYSAENNGWDDPSDGLSCTNADLSCGDGWAGSPSTSWPCLSDVYCAGHGCFGHGRGMCQWGTQRWASTGAKLWNWIEDHYYNANGAGTGYRTAAMTSPFSLSSLAPTPATVSPGGTFTASAQASNAAEVTHTAVILGASISNATSGTFTDAPNDTLVALNPGANSISRPFAVSAAAPPGLYDLTLALWLDTDGDGAITSADLLMTSSVIVGAVTVTGGTCASPVAISSFPYAASNTTSGKTAALNGYSCPPSSGSEAGPEVVYTVTVPVPGTLTVTVTDGVGVDIDPHLLSACDPATCLARSDATFSRFVGAGSYTLVCDTWTSAGGTQYPGAYDLSVTFAPDATPPSPVKNLRWDSAGVRWIWDSVTTDTAGGAELVANYEVRRASALRQAGSVQATPVSTSWTDASTPPSGCWYYAARVVDQAGFRDCESVVDNPGANFAGVWSTGTTAAGRYGADYRFVATGGSGVNTATWSFTPPESGGYEVALWYPQGVNRSTEARFTVNHAGGATLVPVNQQTNGGAWFPLGVYRFLAGQAYTVVLDDTAPAGFVVIADAVRWTQAP